MLTYIQQICIYRGRLFYDANVVKCINQQVSANKAAVSAATPFVASCIKSAILFL